jgi:hypothetical protein
LVTTKHLDLEHQQFAAYPRSSPPWILFSHPSDEVADLAVDLGTAAASTGFPAPIGPKAGRRFGVPGTGVLRP